MALTEIAERIKSLNLADKKILQRVLQQEIESHQIPDTRPDKRMALTQAVINEVDTDLFVDHHDVKAWAKSLATENPLPPPRHGARNKSR